MKISKTGGCLALLVATFLWATGYIVTKNVVAGMPPDFLLAVRYVIAAGLTAVLCIPRRKQMRKGLLAAGIRMGVALFVEFYCFTLGVKYTTASKSSFIIASYIILLPLVYLIIRKKRPAGIDILGAAVCMAGLLIIFGESLNGGFNFGDVVCLGSALGYAVHVVYSAKYAKQYDGMLLNLVQITTMAVIASVVTLCTGSFRVGFGVIPVPQMLYLSVVCTIVPYFLCLLGMKVVSTTTSGIILSSECVFATILAVIFLKETLSWQLIVGGSVIFLSFILTELLKMRMAPKHAKADETESPG